jgi:hypothetical protein
MQKSRPQELYDKAEEERQRCRHWLLPFLRDNQPKFLTKAELRDAATRELKVSKNSFDCAWIEAIEQTGRQGRKVPSISSLHHGVLTQPRPNPKCSASPSFDRLVGAAGAFASQRALGKPAGLR